MSTITMSVDIPTISITEELDEHDDDNSHISFSDDLTDVEDLNEESQLSDNPPRKRSTLKIKLNQDDYLTDLEDLEVSDNEDGMNANIIEHAEPIAIEDLDMEGGTFEESYKTQTKTRKGKRKLKTQMSTTQRDRNDEIEQNTVDYSTEEESYDTDNEVKPEDIPENKLDLDGYNDENLDITERSNKSSSGLLTPVPTSTHSDSNDSDTPYNEIQKSQFLSTLTPFPNMSDLTDIEVLMSDDENESKHSKRTKSRRRRGTRKSSVTDVEDLEISEDDTKYETQARRVRKSRRKLHTRSQSLAFDSDNDGENPLPFPVCKKIAEKKQNILNIPELNIDFATDVEDVDDISESVNSPTSQAGDLEFEEKLAEMATGYGQTTENHRSLKNKIKYRTEFSKLDNIDHHSNTDTDNYETDDSEKPEKIPSISYDIKFSGMNSNESSNKKSLNLSVPMHMSDEAVTDCENIDSSDDEDRNKNMSVALLRQSISFSEEEELDDIPNFLDNLPEVKLPSPIRNMIILRENETLPTVEIFPLSDTPPGSLNYNSGEVLTDEESISQTDEVFQAHSDLHGSSEFIFQDYGVVNELENVQHLEKISKNEKIGDLTDTEEVVLVTQKRRRAPKFKYLHEKFLSEKNNLSVAKDRDNKRLTDTEDVYLSDANEGSFHSLSPRPNLPANGGVTDTEILVESSDEETYQSNIRPLSYTPQHLREMEGETVVSKEGSGPFSSKERSLMNKPMKKIIDTAASPVYTDTEEMATSADEDFPSYSRAETVTPNQIHRDLEQVSSSEVHTEDKRKFDSEGCMYLKGGGYIEYPTDMEDLSEEEQEIISPHVYLSEEIVNGSAVLMSLQDGLASSGSCGEWEATRQTLDLEPKAPTVEEDASQKDVDGSTSGGTSKESAASSVKPEGEEGAEKDESGYERTVADQHQLSEEMKALLKELEKESKQ